MLFFFDIDATMTDTGGGGMRAMQDAGRQLFSPTFTVENISFAGSLDTVLTHQLFTLNNVAITDANIASFRAAYAQHLAQRLATPGTCRALPGVLDLLAAIRALGTPTLRVGSSSSPSASPSASHHPPTLAVLTGNFADTGTMKLRACNIDPEWFSISVFADEVPHHHDRPALREHLVELGLKRYHDREKRPLTPRHAVVIGDTPHDVRCGKAHNTRTLGVATGRFSTSELLAAGADRAVENLADTADILDWLTRV